MTSDQPNNLLVGLIIRRQEHTLLSQLLHVLGDGQLDQSAGRQGCHTFMRDEAHFVRNRTPSTEQSRLTMPLFGVPPVISDQVSSVQFSHLDRC